MEALDLALRGEEEEWNGDVVADRTPKVALEKKLVLYA